MLRSSFLVCCVLLVSTSAAASPGLVKKAAKQQLAYEAGDRAALTEALNLMEPAMAHKKVAADPGAWARLGHLRWENARVTSELGLAEAASSDLAKAVELGAEGEVLNAVYGDQKAILAMMFQRAADELESGRPTEASAALASTHGLRASLAEASIELPAVEERFNVVAAQIELGAGRLDEAIGHHDAHVAAGNVNASLTSAIAQALAKQERVADGLALLAKVRALQPDNVRLLRAEVKLLMESGDVAGAIARVDGAKEVLWGSVSGAYAMFELYRDAAATDAALMAAARVIEQEPQHVDTLRGVGAVRSARADAGQVKLDAGGLPSAEKRKLKTSIAEDRKAVVATLKAARAVDAMHIPTLRALAVAYRAVGDSKAAQAVDDEAARLETPQ